MPNAQTHKDLGSQLAHAMALAQAGQLDAAEASLRNILAKAPEHPDALQLLGLIARQRGAHEQAVALFQQSLAARPEQPNVLNNLGNSLADLSRHAEAIDSYQAAITLTGDYPEAGINRALALIAVGRPAEARAAMQALLAAHPLNARAWAVLGRALADDGDHRAAIEAYRNALRQRPDHVPWQHNLAVALRRCGQLADALPLLSRCAEASPTDPRILYNLGHCLQDLGRVDDAVDAYRRAIRLAPTDTQMHESLSRLLWQAGRTAEHLQTYRAALAEHPDDPGLLTGLAHRLTLAGAPQEAVALLAPAVARGVGGVALAHGLGRALWSAAQPEQAGAAFHAALAHDPDHAPTLRELARIGLILDRPADTADAIARLLAADPTDQQALALQGIAWRLAGDPRAQWLNDPALIGVEQLFEGHTDVLRFNHRLDRRLDAMHTATQHPLEQTLRGGSQTTDDLFSRDVPELATLRGMIEQAVTRYIRRLPDDPTHPFLSRASSAFAFSGSWSVRLHSGGHHENHIHPEGWISAVYYVALPNAVAQGQQGWLKFGETALKLGDREQIIQMVRPDPGLLVLFPSYFYHGTVPFSDTAHRTTIAFDIVPAG